MLHEDLIIEDVQKAVDERLQGCNASRTYFTQALLPGAAGPLSSSPAGEGKGQGGKEKRTGAGSGSGVSVEGLDKERNTEHARMLLWCGGMMWWFAGHVIVYQRIIQCHTCTCS